MEYEQLVERVKRALEAGELEPRELERLLERRDRRRRPETAGVLRAAGLVIVFAGAGFLYAIGFEGYGHAVRMLTPFLFPAAALAACVALARVGRPAWEVELAALVGYIALGLAFAAAGGVVDAHSGSATLASAIALAVVVGVERVAHVTRVTRWALPAALVALTGFASAALGWVDDGDVGWLFLGQAAAAAAFGAAMLRRRPGLAAAAWQPAVLLAYAAVLAGIDDWSSVSPWHAVLTVLVAAVLIGAAFVDGLTWLGALGGLLWLGAVGGLVGTSSSWALGVVLFGAGLVGLSLVVARLHRSGPGRLAT
jgi:hypothetical protein